MKFYANVSTDRITMRSYQTWDYGFVSGMWFDKENGKYLSDPEKMYIDEKFKNLLKEMSYTPEGYYFVVEDRDTGLLVDSCCAFPNLNSENKFVFDIGYCVHKSLWRQGYGTEIVTLLLSWIKEFGYGVSVTAEVAKDNIASVELLKKLGFKIIKESSFKKYNMNISFDSYIFEKKL